MEDHEAAELEQAVEVKLFLRDTRHLRFEETATNFDALETFLHEHGLPINRGTLHCAYENLVERGELELTPLAPVVIEERPSPSQSPTPVPAAPEQQIELSKRQIAWRNGKSKTIMTKAIYRDAAGNQFSCPVVKNDGAWNMVTSEGPQPITYDFQDDVGGILTFVEYRETEDLRLHIDRLPGESSFGALQRTYAEKVVAQQRRDRQQARTEIQNTNIPDAQKVQAARNANNYAANRMRPRRGPAVIKGD